eukprot:UC4_evm1s335
MTKIVHWWKGKVAARLSVSPKLLRLYANEHWGTLQEDIDTSGFSPPSDKGYKRFICSAVVTEKNGFVSGSFFTYLDIGLYYGGRRPSQADDHKHEEGAVQRSIFRHAVRRVLIPETEGVRVAATHTYYPGRRTEEGDTREDSDSYKDEIMDNVDLLGDGDLPEKAESGGNLFTRYLWQMAFPALKNASKKKKAKILLILDDTEGRLGKVEASR